MSKILRFLESDFRRAFFWAGIIIIIHGIRTVLLNQPWELRQTLLAIFFVISAEIAANYFIQKSKKQKHN